VGVVPVALEIQDGVHHVLQQPGARELVGLGHVPDQHHGDPGHLGQVAQLRAAPPQLRDRARARGQVRAVDHLDRVDDQDCGHDLARLLDDAGEVGIREHVQRIGALVVNP
jgi:hypothetical protein